MAGAVNPLSADQNIAREPPAATPEVAAGGVGHCVTTYLGTLICIGIHRESVRIPMDDAATICGS